MPGLDFVIPITVELIATNFDLIEFLIGDLDASRIGLWIQFRMNPETGGGGGTGDKVDDGFEISQRLAPPVLADVGEEPMLDLFHLLVPGGKWQTKIRSAVSSANC